MTMNESEFREYCSNHNMICIRANLNEIEGALALLIGLPPLSARVTGQNENGVVLTINGDIRNITRKVLLSKEGLSPTELLD